MSSVKRTGWFLRLFENATSRELREMNERLERESSPPFQRPGRSRSVHDASDAQREPNDNLSASTGGTFPRRKAAFPVPDHIKKITQVIQPEELKFGRELRRGGEGVVWRATWSVPKTNVQREVVVKLSFKASTFVDMDESILSELEIMSKLEHPHIIKLHGICSVVEPREAVGMVMDYIPDGSLNLFYYDQSYRDRKHLVSSLKTKLMIARDIALGLAYLHEHNIVHRDLKSDNVLVKFEHNIPVCLLTDFGVSKLVETNSAVLHTFSGTPNYMAPEVLLGEAYTEKADIYSLAILLWEVFTIERPWDGNTLGLILSSVTQHKMRPPLNVLEDASTPALMMELIQQSWDEDAAKRKNAKQLKEIVLAMYNSFTNTELFL